MHLFQKIFLTMIVILLGYFCSGKITFFNGNITNDVKYFLFICIALSVIRDILL